MPRLDDVLWSLWGTGSFCSHRSSVGTERAIRWEQEIHQPYQNVTTSVPTVPTTLDIDTGTDGRSDVGEACAAWEERAAILEFEGGMSRAEAECAASEMLQR